MKPVLTFLFGHSKLLFAFAFLTPLYAQLMELAGWQDPFGLPTLSVAAVIAGAFGLVAHMRGYWL